MNIFVYTYPLSTLYIPRIVRVFLYATKHISNTNGIQTSPLVGGGGSDKSNLIRIRKKERELRLLCQSLHKTRGTREKTFSPEEDRERRGENTITVERTTRPTMHDVSPPFWGGGAAYICFILKHIHAYTTKPPTLIHHIYNT